MSNFIAIPPRQHANEAIVHRVIFILSHDDEELSSDALNDAEMPLCRSCASAEMRCLRARKEKLERLLNLKKIGSLVSEVSEWRLPKPRVHIHAFLPNSRRVVFRNGTHAQLR